MGRCFKYSVDRKAYDYPLPISPTFAWVGVAVFLLGEVLFARARGASLRARREGARPLSHATAARARALGPLRPLVHHAVLLAALIGALQLVPVARAANGQAHDLDWMRNNTACDVG
jgi:hypothetical protein